MIPIPNEPKGGMSSALNLGQEVSATMLRNRHLAHDLRFKNPIRAELWRASRKIWEDLTFNDITNEGKNQLFEIMFHDGTQIAASAWCIGLISNSGYSALAAGDTMASHAGWAEATGYTQSTRVAWGAGAAASQAITNSSPATFDLNATATIKGIFVASQNTKTGTSGKLWATALFSADVPVVSGDQLRVTYTVSA